MVAVVWQGTFLCLNNTLKVADDIMSSNLFSSISLSKPMSFSCCVTYIVGAFIRKKKKKTM